MLSKIFTVINGFKKTTVIYIIFLIFISLLVESFSLGLLIPVIGYFISPDLSNVINLKDFFYLFPDYEIEKNNFFNYLILTIFIFFLSRYIFLNYLALKLYSFIGDANMLISEKLLRIYLSKNYKWHTNYDKSDFLQILTRDIENFCGNTLYGLLFILSELFLFTGVVIFLLVFEAKIFFVLLIVSAIFFPALYVFSKKYSYNLGKKYRDNQNFLLKTVNESLSGIKELILYNWKDKVTHNFSLGQKKVVKSAAVYGSLQDISRYTLEIFAIILFLIFIYYLNLNSDGETNIITIGIFSAALFRLMPIMNRISTYAQRLKFGMSAADKIVEFYKYDIEKNNNTEDLEFKDNLILKNVSYEYEKNKEPILKNINLKINKNEIIGIVGESGVGKTTLTNIIMGLLKPTNGEIIVDGVNIIKDKMSIGKNIGFVPQNFFSINSSILNNIVFFERKINLRNLIFAIRNSLLIGTILEKKLSLKSDLGNNSLKVSGGQLQRINIARALYRKPKILILDEPTSSLDEKNQKLFEQILISLKNKMSIIVITHNLKFSNEFDKIFKIEKQKLNQIK